MQLTAAQQLAVDRTDGPVLIIAGPGSGKTYTLVERVVHLVTACAVKPEQILIATFTEKAASELITRVSNRLGETGQSVNLAEMYIGTLHSICLRIVDEHREFTRLKRSYAVLDQFEQQYLVYRQLKKFKELPSFSDFVGAVAKSNWETATDLVSWFNKCSEELLDGTTLSGAADPRIAALGSLYARYLELLTEENALDFSTIQVEAWRLLEQQPQVRDALRRQIRYAMVDEYQDTNTVQEAVIKLLVGDEGNLCVVGDDDQGLYRFRGATIRNILEFPRLFPDRTCERIELTANYRSHKDIVEFFQQWMNRMEWRVDGRQFRFDKEITAASAQSWIGPAVQRVGADGVDAWCAEVLAFLLELRSTRQLTDLNQVAFLFRSVKHDNAMTLARFLDSNGIPVYAPRSDLFFERPEVRRLVGALLAMFPQFDEVVRAGWPSGAEEPAVWAWYDACVGEFMDVSAVPENEELRKWVIRARKRHASMAENADYAFSGLFYQLLQFPLFAGPLGDASLGGVVDSRPARNLAILSRLLTRFEHLHRITVLNAKWLERDLWSLGNQYFRFLFDGGIGEFEDVAEYAPSGCVNFMTVHQAKGLEFPIVIVDSLYAVPRKNHVDLDEQLQDGYYRKPAFEPWDQVKAFDFMRLYYTAFSRAQNLLVLTAPIRTKGQRIPSAWFKAVWDELPDWRACRAALATMKLDRIKPVNLKHEYSFTGDIAAFETCARQYKFFNELEFTPVRSHNILFGTLVHQTIDDVHKAALRGQSEQISESQVEVWFEENYRYLTSRERRYLAPKTKAAVLKQVQRYVRNQEHAGWSHIVATEVDVSLVKPGYILNGSIDLIAGQGDTVEVVDFKSEKKPDLARDSDKVERYRRQLEVYGHLVEQRLGKTVSALHLHYTAEPEGSNPRILFRMERRSVQRTIDGFDAVVARIERKDFDIDRRPPQHVCDGCDMRHHCDRL